MPQLYVLDTDLASDQSLYAGGQWINDTRQRCPDCMAFDRSTEPEVLEIALNQLGRSGFAEYLWNSHVLPIFRQDLVELWHTNKLTGFDVKPVLIVSWWEEPDKPLPADIPKYYRLVTTSNVGLSEPPVRVARCGSCGFTEYAFPKTGTYLPQGMHIDEKTYDGADICGVNGYEFVFLSRRAAEVTLAAKYKHIGLVLIQKWGSWRPFDIRTWTSVAYQHYLEGFIIRRPADL